MQSLNQLIKDTNTTQSKVKDAQDAIRGAWAGVVSANEMRQLTGKDVEWHSIEDLRPSPTMFVETCYQPTMTFSHGYIFPQDKVQEGCNAWDYEANWLGTSEGDNSIFAFKATHWRYIEFPAIKVTEAQKKPDWVSIEEQRPPYTKSALEKGYRLSYWYNVRLENGIEIQKACYDHDFDVWRERVPGTCKDELIENEVTHWRYSKDTK